MPSPPRRPSRNVAIRRLSRTLRALRTEAGLAQEQVREGLEMSQGKLSRLENGDYQRLNMNDLRALLDYYRVPGDKREALLELARASRQPGWWETYDNVLGSGYAGFEQEAESISTYQPLVIPGLLQTSAYADAAIRGDQITDPREIRLRIDFRMKRQEILARRRPPRLLAIIDQAALIRPFGTTDDRREQLQRLIDTAGSGHTTVQVIPFSAGMHAGLACGFTILDYGDDHDPSIAYVEMGGNALYLENPDELHGHRLRFQNLRDTALDPDATTYLLSQIMNDLK